jgi:hypothetical protein
MNVWNGERRRIIMNEVGTRDGLQVEEAFVPTQDKIDLINALSEAGLSKIEVTAFVSAQAIPALRDAEIVMREIQRKPGVVYTALVPNMRGAERHRRAHRRVESRDVGQRKPQPGQPAHDTRPILPRPARSGPGRQECWRRYQRLAVMFVRLPH